MKDLMTILITLSLTLCQLFVLFIVWLLAVFRMAAAESYREVSAPLENYMFNRLLVAIFSALFCGILMSAIYWLSRKLVLRFEVPMPDIRTRTFLKWQILVLFCFSVICSIYFYYYYTQMPLPE